MKFKYIFLGAAIMCSSTVNAALVSVTQESGDSYFDNVLGTGASAAIIAAPANITNDHVGGAAVNINQEGFNENQGVITTLAHVVDGGGVIAAGKHVNSHMIFMNSPDVPGQDPLLSHLDVVWTFKNKIIGVMSDIDGALEAASNVDFAAVGTLYPTSFFRRGMEPETTLYGEVDGYNFSGLNDNQIRVSMNVREPGDWIRVLTAAVPVPAAVWLFGTALIGFIGFSRRRIVA